MLAPDAVDELVHRYHSVGLDQQRHQHTPLPGMAEVEEATVEVGLDTAE
jgi:hypothetical protein